MNRKIGLCLALGALLALGGGAYAQAPPDACVTIDAVPAATLLLPYFEVDWTDPEGIDTLFSINNASAAPVVAHVVFWTDLSIPTIDFDVFLTGYDVQTLSIANIFRNGTLPVTSHLRNDTGDAFSPSPPLGPTQPSVWDGNNSLGRDLGATCDNKLPFDDPALDADLLAHIRGAHTGGSSTFFSNRCSGLDYEDGVARGYVTVDVVTRCSLEFPDRNAEYYTTTLCRAEDCNVLWGDYFYVDPENNFAQGETLVHSEYSAELAASAAADGDYTFWGRYTVNPLGADGREPLGTTFANRYLNDFDPFDGSDLVVWRDAKQASSALGTAAGPFVCANGPTALNWFPLEETQVVAFDEEENAVELCGGLTDEGPISPPRQPEAEVCFPAEAQRVPISGLTPVPFADSLDVSFPYGWIFTNLNHVNADTGKFDGIAQAWVTVLMSAEGRFSVGFDAIQLDNASDYNTGGDVTPTIVLPPPAR